MKNIFDIYNESLVGSDTDVEASVRQSLITKEYVIETLKRCIPTIEYYDVLINEDKTIKVLRFNYKAQDNGATLINDLPAEFVFSEFAGDDRVVVGAFGDTVTTLRGLPRDLSKYEVKIVDTPNLKDFGNIEVVKTLVIKQGKDKKLDIKKIKKLPKALKYIRLIGFDDVDEKYISKISGVPRNKITVL